MSSPSSPYAGHTALAPLRGACALVTGANGYVGREMTRALLDAGVSAIRAVDVDVSAVAPSERVTPIVLDLAGDSAAVARAVSGVNVVIHVASYGMSGPAMLETKRIYAVNVEGTRALLDACVAAGVSAFVYTSTCNVVFGGQEIVNGEEASLPYFPDERHVDEYSRTKSLAEQLVLEYNGRGRVPLRCAAIRPNAIYGEGEERHFVRIVDLAVRGMARFTIGPASSRLDWVHVTNVALAHLLAAANLLGPEHTAAGEAFFVSDGCPVNQWEFISPLLQAVGAGAPLLNLPTWLMLPVAHAMELLHSSSATRWMFRYIPLLTRAEVNKCSVTHYFSNEKARRVLQYEPVITHPEGMASVAEVWRRKMAGKAAE